MVLGVVDISEFKYFHGISASLLNEIIEANQKVLLIDIRPPAAFQSASILNSINFSPCKSMLNLLRGDNQVPMNRVITLCSGNTTLANLRQYEKIIVYDDRAINKKLIAQSEIYAYLLTRVCHISSTFYLSDGFDGFLQNYPSRCRISVSDYHSFYFPSLILPNLYLGSEHHVRNKDVLKKLDIRYILNVAIGGYMPADFGDGHYMKLPLYDSISQHILPFLTVAWNFIDLALETKSNVLVHCMAGISRSAAIVVSYVMKKLCAPLELALSFVKHRRPCIEPNFNFLGQLMRIKVSEIDFSLLKEDQTFDNAKFYSTIETQLFDVKNETYKQSPFYMCIQPGLDYRSYLVRENGINNGRTNPLKRKKMECCLADDTNSRVSKRHCSSSQRFEKVCGEEVSAYNNEIKILCNSNPLPSKSNDASTVNVENANVTLRLKTREVAKRPTSLPIATERHL